MPKLPASNIISGYKFRLC